MLTSGISYSLGLWDDFYIDYGRVVNVFSIDDAVAIVIDPDLFVQMLSLSPCMQCLLYR